MKRSVAKKKPVAKTQRRKEVVGKFAGPLTRDEAVALVNVCSIAVKNLPAMPPDFRKILDAAVNKVMRSWRLQLCGCCDLVAEEEEDE